MCHGPYGSNHREYLPGRSATSSYWRRLPTIYEATDIELAIAEKDASETLGESFAQNAKDTERLLGKKEIWPRRKAAKRDKIAKERSMRYKICFGKSGVIETEASLFQQVNNELKYFLRTPYAEFFPENTATSILETCFSPNSAKKKETKAFNTAGLQADRCSEIAAWLEFFG